MGVSADEWRNNQLVGDALALLKRAIPPGRVVDRRTVHAAANKTWSQLNHRERQQLADELRRYGFPGSTDYKLFLAFSRTALLSSAAERRLPPVGNAPESNTATDVLAQMHEFIFKRFRRAEPSKPPSTRQLLDALTIYWQNLGQDERRELRAVLRSKGFRTGSLLENMVAYARTVLSVPAPAHKISISKIDNSQRRHTTMRRPSRPRLQARVAASPSAQTARTGDGRLAPTCKYCGAPTVLGRTYTFCDAVEKTREEWQCTRTGCEGITDPMLTQYALTEFSRRGG